jgi:hypothetical protein
LGGIPDSLNLTHVPGRVPSNLKNSESNAVVDQQNIRSKSRTLVHNDNIPKVISLLQSNSHEHNRLKQSTDSGLALPTGKSINGYDRSRLSHSTRADISQSSKSSSSISDSGECLGRSSGENNSRVTRPNTKKSISFADDILTQTNSSITSHSNQHNTVSEKDTVLSEGKLEDFKYLIGKYHRDNEDYQRYVTDKVYVDKKSGYIVGERILILKDGRRHRSPDPHPIHVRDLAEMTRQYEEESSPIVQKALIVNLLEST